MIIVVEIRVVVEEVGVLSLMIMVVVAVVVVVEVVKRHESGEHLVICFFEGSEIVEVDSGCLGVEVELVMQFSSSARSVKSLKESR